MLGLLSLLAIGAAVFVLLMSVYTVHALTRPPRRTYAWALARNVPGDPSELDQPLDFTETTLAGLSAWRITGRDPSAPRVVLIHGWASGKVSALVRIPTLAAHASEVVVLELPGHGDTPGPSTLGTTDHERVHAAMSELDRAPTVLAGWSMGAGIALRVAQDHTDFHDIRAVIAESPYAVAKTPANNVIRMKGMPRALNLPLALASIGTRRGIGPTWHGFDRTQIAKNVRVPILLIHGTDDAVCPIEDSHAIASAAPNARLETIDGAGHNNLWTDPEFAPRVRELVSRFLIDQAQPAADSAPTA